MKKTVFTVFAFCMGVWASAETLPVNSFHYAGPFALKQPFMIDSVDVNAKPFAAERFLDTPLSFDALGKATQVSSLPTATEGYALHLAAFLLENSAYAEASIKVEGLKHYQLYVDGEKKEKGALKLEPASHEIVIKYLTKAGEQANPQVSVESEKSTSITLKDSGKRMYTLNDVLHGIRMADVDLSPDGKYLIASFRTNKVGGKSETITRVTELATGKVVAERTESLHWMPRSVAYYYTRNGVDGKQLVTVDPTTGAEKIVADRLPEGRFQWAPTEDYLLFTLTQEGPAERKDVYEVIVPDDRQPGWRTRSYLAKYDLNTGLMQPLTFGFHSARANDISADGRYLLISTQEDRLTARPTTLNTLYRLDLETLQAETLVEKDGFLSRASFSPDGTQVLLFARMFRRYR